MSTEPVDAPVSKTAPFTAARAVWVLRDIQELLWNLRIGAQEHGLWPHEEPSLGVLPEDLIDVLGPFITIAYSCDLYYDPVPEEGERRSCFLALPDEEDDWWRWEADRVIRHVGAAIDSLADAWGIQGMRPGAKDYGPRRGDEEAVSAMERALDGSEQDRAWITPLTTAQARTIERCLARLDQIIDRIEGENGQSNESPILTPKQQRALELLDGRAKLGKELAAALDIAEPTLIRSVTNELQALRRIKNDARMGGYYRPDAPPMIDTNYIQTSEDGPRD